MLRSTRFIAIAALGLALIGAATDQSPQPKTERPLTPARAMFERFKALEGVWVGGNTDGLPSTMTYQVIAGGSCVMETTEFKAHPDTTMVTMFHLDGEHLMLTHYCVARNQPRMRATEFSEDGAAVTFTFHDGTNMGSRDVGHMDSAWFKFIDADHLASKWSWYQNGKHTWMEEFTYQRRKPAEPSAPGVSPR